MVALLPQSCTSVKTERLKSHENQVVSPLWRRALGRLWVINFLQTCVFCVVAVAGGGGCRGGEGHCL